MPSPSPGRPPSPSMPQLSQPCLFKTFSTKSLARSMAHSKTRSAQCFAFHKFSQLLARIAQNISRLQTKLLIAQTRRWTQLQRDLASGGERGGHRQRADHLHLLHIHLWLPRAPRIHPHILCLGGFITLSSYYFLQSKFLLKKGDYQASVCGSKGTRTKPEQKKVAQEGEHFIHQYFSMSRRTFPNWWEKEDIHKQVREAILCQIGCFFTHCVNGP